MNVMKKKKGKDLMSASETNLNDLEEEVQERLEEHYGEPIPCISKKEPEIDMVNNPPHYNSHPSGVECIDVIRHMPHCVATAIKYLWRAGLKDPEKELEDVQKAIWYLKDREAELKGETPVYVKKHVRELDVE